MTERRKRKRRSEPQHTRLDWRSYAFLAFLLALAYMCVGVQLDYAVEQRPALSRLVLPPFRAEALTPLADLAIAAEAGNSAVTRSQRLVEAQPVAAENLSRLARAYALANNPVKAQEALVAAAGRGWRDPLSQIVILESAIQTGEWPIVAQRLAAMRKLRFPREVTDSQLQRLAQIPEGRDQLATQLAADTLWQGQFARYALDVMPPDQFAAIFRSVMETEQGIACPTHKQVATLLLRKGAGSDAKSLWSGPCVAQLAGPLGDPAFPKVGAEESSAGFGWTYPRQQSLSRTVSTGNGSAVLDFHNNGRLRRILAQRYLALEPGAHQVRLRSEQVGDPAEISVGVICVGGRRSLPLSQTAPDVWTFEIPADRCGAQWLRITASPGRGRVSGAAIDA